MFEVRKAVIGDLPIIMKIIESARIRLKADGSPQWQDGYGPNEASMCAAIQQGVCRVGLLASQLVAVACLIPGIDDVYTAIENGQWADNSDNERYLSIHRFAVFSDFSGQGVATSFLEALKTEAFHHGYRDLRIDTYPKNQAMIRVIEKNGFEYRGMVYFPIPDGERVAFQMVLDSHSQSDRYE